MQNNWIITLVFIQFLWDKGLNIKKGYWKKNNVEFTLIIDFSMNHEGMSLVVRSRIESVWKSFKFCKTMNFNNFDRDSVIAKISFTLVQLKLMNLFLKQRRYAILILMNNLYSAFLWHWEQTNHAFSILNYNKFIINSVRWEPTSEWQQPFFLNSMQLFQPCNIWNLIYS